MGQMQIKKEKFNAIWKAAKKVLFFVGIFLCAFFLVVASWLAVDKFILKSPVPSFAGYSLLSVESGSMEGKMKDSIDKWDLVLIRKTNEYKIGETITFLREGEKVPTTHRIIDFDYTSGEKAYITKGDANDSRDKVVYEEEIVGEVVVIFKHVGVIRGWLTEGGGFIFVVALLSVLFVGIYFIKDLKPKTVSEEGETPSNETDLKQVETGQQGENQRENNG